MKLYEWLALPTHIELVHLKRVWKLRQTIILIKPVRNIEYSHRYFLKINQIKNKLLHTYIQMKTITLHTISYQPMLEKAWGGICVFNSDRIRLEGIILG